MFARTDRLLLRPWWPEDAPALRALIADAEVARAMAQLSRPFDASGVEDFCNAPHASDLPRFAVTRRTRGAPQLIGGVLLHRGDAGAELHYWIARPLWGLGYATEAAEQVARIADTLGHRQIVARHARGDAASARVLAKIGFRADGALRRRGGGADEHVRSVRPAGATAVRDGDPVPVMAAGRIRELMAA